MLTRATTLDDIADVTAVLSASYPNLMQSAYEPSLLEAVLPLMTKANPALLASGSYFVAIADDGAFAGCGGWTRERPGTGEQTIGLGHIRHFATHPDYIAQGVGRTIYLNCRAQAQSRGIGQFECYASLNAEGFYRRLGFEVVERIEVPFASGRALPSLRMACAL